MSDEQMLRWVLRLGWQSWLREPPPTKLYTCVLTGSEPKAQARNRVEIMPGTVGVPYRVGQYPNTKAPSHDAFRYGI